MTHALDKTVLSVKSLLSLTDVTIPAYQRPYKWTVKNISELFADIDSHLDKSAYRLGSVVFHHTESDEKNKLDIVDGQQRTLTLMLAVWAIIWSISPPRLSFKTSWQNKNQNHILRLSTVKSYISNLWYCRTRLIRRCALG